MFDPFLEFYVRVFAVLLPATATAFTAIFAVRAGLPLARAVGACLVLSGLLALWYAGVSLMAEIGLLTPPPTLLDPPYVMMILLGGAALLWSLARLTRTGRRISDSIDQQALMGFQIFRVMGGLHTGLDCRRDSLAVRPPGRIGRHLGGGYRAMNALNRGAADAETKVLWANVIGLADFVVAVLTGLITSEGFLHLLAQDRPNIINAYPLGLFPGFIVPLFIAFHLVSLGKLRQARQRAALA